MEEPNTETKSTAESEVTAEESIAKLQAALAMQIEENAKLQAALAMQIEENAKLKNSAKPDASKSIKLTQDQLDKTAADLTLFNDAFAKLVFEDLDAVQTVVQITTDQPGASIDKTATQKEINLSF